jgi:Arc/MetJ family transcription regulator
MLVRTNVTLPEELLAEIDDVAGPRGRSRYIADVLTREVRRDQARRVFAGLAGAMRGSGSWGATPEETDRLLREVRSSEARDARVRGGKADDEVPPGHDAPR